MHLQVKVLVWVGFPPAALPEEVGLGPPKPPCEEVAPGPTGKPAPWDEVEAGPTGNPPPWLEVGPAWPEELVNGP